MQFHEHLQAFFGSSMEEPEARIIATTVLAENVRSLKLSIARHLWNARQSTSGADGPGDRRSVAHLDNARRLKRRFDSTLEEYVSLSDPGNRQDPGGTERKPA